MEWTKEDEKNLEKLLAVSEDETTEWLEKKAKEMKSLMAASRRRCREKAWWLHRKILKIQ